MLVLLGDGEITPEELARLKEAIERAGESERLKLERVGCGCDAVRLSGARAVLYHQHLAGPAAHDGRMVCPEALSPHRNQDLPADALCSLDDRLSSSVVLLFSAVFDSMVVGCGAA